ncbi:MAG: glutaredoxin family protein [Acidobacteriia bacterium]|nr:glutaredoxin family protein [Terriglobia bacterium]
MVTKQVRIYTRRGCHLCERVEDLVDSARSLAAFDLEIVDVDSDEALRIQYGQVVPVVAIDGQDLFGHAMDLDAFVERLK